MAALETPTRDEGRPPDTPMFKRKSPLTKNYGRYSYVTKSVPTNPFVNQDKDESYIGFNELLEDNIKVQDVNKNNLTDSTINLNKAEKTSIKSDKPILKHGFPKILCLKKGSLLNLSEKTEINAFNTLNVNSLENLSETRTNGCTKIASKSNLDNKNENINLTENPKEETDYSNNYYSEKPKNRNSFHQNVEEALSSLLWQPYEYQNQENNDYCFVINGNGNYDYESYSTCSYTPSSSPISLDLDDPCDNVASSPSNTKNNIPSSAFLQCTAVPPQRRDLHSDVINLNQQEVSAQPATRIPPRDRLLQRSGTVAFVSLPSLASSNLDSLSGSVRDYELVTSCTEGFSGDLSMQSGSNGTSNKKSVPVSNLSASTSENGLKNNAIKVDTSLNAANIVGLPSSHSRYASVPCSSTSASVQNGHAGTRSQNVAGTVYPQHFRNFSEPSDHILRYPNNISAVPSVHQKPHNGTAGTSTLNSQIDHRNLQLINHFRSSSVPKSMTLVPKYDVTTSSGPVNSLRVKGAQVLPQNGSNFGHTGGVSNNGTVSCGTAKLINRPTVPLNISVSTQNLNQDGTNVQNTRPSPLKLLSSSAPTTVSPSSPGTANVSNVNVNFYRAVPVNVVSSVPTIHCLNTLSNDQGNSVSNVQVLPLGGSNQQIPVQTKNNTVANQFAVANSVNNVENQRVTNASTVASTEVTVRNINAIQIGTSNSANQIITSTVGYPEHSYRNHVTNNISDYNAVSEASTRNAVGAAVSVAQGHEGNRGVLLQNASTSTFPGGIATSFLTPSPVTTTEIPVNNISNVVNVQNDARQPVFSAEVPYQLAGRFITTTAQINSSPVNQAQMGAAVGPQIQNIPTGTSILRTRTFTSTEAQTDDILPVAQSTSTQNHNIAIREQRRRERRERRQNRRNHGHGNASRGTTNDSNSQSAGNAGQTQGQTANAGSQNQAQNSQEIRLPDLLHSHLPPPYSTLPNNQNVSMIPPVPPRILPSPPQIIPGAMLPNPHGPVLQTVVPNGVPASAFVFPAPQQIAPLMQGGAPVPVAVPATAASGFRFGFPANGFRRSRFSEDSPKGCCGFISWKPGSLRWFIALIALVAVCCVLVGTALGAMRPAGRDHLTVSLLMIGVGIVLITVSGVAWRLTSHDSSTCRSMLGLGSTESVDVCTRRFVPRLPPSYGRPHHPYAAMMYPEFQYRPPPPSYQASMQEYRLRLLLLDRGNTPQIQAGIQNAVSPPPTYRSHAGSLLRAPLSSRRDNYQSEYSCPPSYRSQNSSNRPGTLQGSILHSRDPSLTMSDSNHESVVNVVNILGSTEEDIALDNITLDSLKMEPESTDINPLKMLLKGSQSDLEGSKDENLVTIVQTSDQNPVIVTVSGCSHDNNSTVQITEIPSEMEILAHL